MTTSVERIQLCEEAKDILVNRITVVNSDSLRGVNKYFIDRVISKDLFMYISPLKINTLLPSVGLSNSLTIKDIVDIREVNEIESVLFNSVIEWQTMNNTLIKEFIDSLAESITDTITDNESCMLPDEYKRYAIDKEECVDLLNNNRWFVFLYALQMSNFAYEFQQALSERK